MTGSWWEMVKAKKTPAADGTLSAERLRPVVVDVWV